MKIIAATAVTMFSLVTVFVATIAWFAMNIEVTATGPSIDVKVLNQKFSKLTLHKYLGTEVVNNQGTFHFDQNPSGTFTYNWLTGVTTFKPTDPTDPEPSTMAPFSLLDPRHPMLALIEFSDTFDTSVYHINVNVSTTHDFLCDVDATGAFIEPLDDENNPLSSVVQFNANHFVSLNSNTGTYESTASFKFSIPGADDYVHFASLTKNETTGALTYNGWNKNLTLADYSDGTSVKYIAIIIDYYDDAFEYIYNMYLGNEYLERELVTFNCDWKMEI